VDPARRFGIGSAAGHRRAERTIKAYVREAIAVEKAGRRVEKKTTSDFLVSEELIERFRRNPRFKRAFEAMNQGGRGATCRGPSPGCSMSRTSPAGGNGLASAQIVTSHGKNNQHRFRPIARRARA
jgi:hypothetical protein